MRRTQARMDYYSREGKRENGGEERGSRERERERRGGKGSRERERQRGGGKGSRERERKGGRKGEQREKTEGERGSAEREWKGGKEEQREKIFLHLPFSIYKAETNDALAHAVVRGNAMCIHCESAAYGEATITTRSKIKSKVSS